MATLANYKLSSTDWVSLNSVRSITVGDSFNVQNLSYYPVHVYESTTKPLITDNSGPILWPKGWLTVRSGSDETWVKLVDGYNGVATLHIGTN